MAVEDKTVIFTQEQQTTIRFQLIFGMAMLVVGLVVFWAASNIWTVDLRFGMLFTMVVLALTWFKDGLIMLADVFIVLMKARGGK